MIYLDSAATGIYSPIEDIVVNAMTEAMNEYWQNPSSLYAVDVKEKINQCRANIAKFINAKPEEIIFTSGASESNNLALRGWADEIWSYTYKTPNIITTRIEHKSILELLDKSNIDAEVVYCDVNELGIIDYEMLEQLLLMRKSKPVLVSVHMANSEIGVLQDIRRISDLVHQYGGVLHVDATQALPYVPINVEEIGIDLMSASGHKISSVLKGIGFLYKKDCINIQPLIYGAQENHLRGGTENTFGIIGLSKAIDYCCVDEKRIADLRSKRDYFIGSLEYKFGCKLNGHCSQRLPNNINVTFPQNITGEALLYMLDMSDIKVSTGSACNSKSIEPSYVLKAIGLTDDEAMRTIRITISDDITYEQIDYVINEIDKAIKLIET